MGTKLAVGTAAVLLTIPLLIAAGLAGILASLTGSSASLSALTCTPDGTPTGSVAGLTGEQLGNAATIVAVGTQLGVPAQGWVVAIAAAMQESGLRNLDHGDRDSLGLFQQRPSMGWGTPQQITTPTYAATAFFQHLTATPGWQTMSVNDAAQAVQHSGTPSAYAQHETLARTIVAAVAGVRCQPAPAVPGSGDCDTIHAENPAVTTVLSYACAQRGLPYVWGGNGPDNGDAGFDCSGLTQAAYAAAGITLPRTANTQYQATTRVPEAELRPGDLVFFGDPNTGIHHVGLYLDHGQMIDAPTFGTPVGVRPVRYPGDDFAGGGRVP